MLNEFFYENVIVVKGVDQFVSCEGVYMLILIEYCVGGNLNECFKEVSIEDENLWWMLQMFVVFFYLYLNEVVYCDLKLDNVFLMVVGDVKLVDFGLV